MTETVGATPAVADLIHRFDSALQDRAYLGGKGASLARMVGSLNLPVPPGFTITTKAWKVYASESASVPPELVAAVEGHLHGLGVRLGLALDDPERPLLVSVRSGSPVSMPGMMDTVLNVGMSDEVVLGVAARTTERFAFQSYARLLATFAEVVREIPAAARAATAAQASDVDDEAAIVLWMALIEEHGAPFPQTAVAQVRESIEAVWRSWNRPRAKRYRRYRGIPEDLGTAVTVQAMVFGNLDDNSGTGVVFTRDPGTGDRVLYGDFMRCAQGEDVVSGTQIPESIESLRDHSVPLWDALQIATQTLEQDTHDMCDVEFTVQRGELFILQSRPGQRSPAAAVRVAVDMVEEGLIDVSTALDRVSLSALQHLQEPVAKTFEGLTVLGSGVSASPGTGVGHAVLDPGRAEAMLDQGLPPLLVCPTTSPQDINGMIVSAGIVTALGGRASHAAVVARGMGKPAVCGVEGMTINQDERTVLFASGAVIREGDLITVSGDRGLVLEGGAEFELPESDRWVEALLGWCDERASIPLLRKMPEDVVVVRSPADVVSGPARVLVDVPWEGPDSCALLERTCREAMDVENAPAELLIALPPDLAGIDFRPPDGPWTGVVVTGANVWAGRLLSARLSNSSQRG